MRIALFITCVGDALFPEAGRATVAVLERLGHEVVFPPEQTCCGQLHVNSGYRDEGLALARRFVRVFGDYKTIVAPSSSCVGNVREIVPQLAREAGDETFAAQAEELGARVFELSELLVRKLGVEDVGARMEDVVTFHDGCHALRELGIKSAPRRLLANVRGLELREMTPAEECCGFGGTFSVKFAELSGAMARTKLDAIEQTGARTVVSLDPSCLMQIQGALSRAGLKIRTLHLAEVLASR